MSLVQAVATDNGSGSASIVITCAATTLGNTIVVAVSLDGTTVSATGVTDNASGGSNPYTLRIGSLLGSGANQYFFTAENVKAGVTTITVALSGSQDGCAWMAEESGLVTTGNYDDSKALYNSGVISFTSNNATASQASDIAYGMAGIGTSSQFLSVGGSWSALTGTGFGGGGKPGLHVNSAGGVQILGGRQALSTTGTYAFTGACTASENVGATVLLLKTVGTGVFTPYTQTQFFETQTVIQ